MKWWQVRVCVGKEGKVREENEGSEGKAPGAMTSSMVGGNW
jgi:hypothetical protein